jgi:phosphatidate cytidylyltransferase
VSALAALVGALLGLLATPAYSRRGVRPNWRGPAILAVWIVLPLCALVLVPVYAGTSGLVALLVLSKLGDIAGYYVGSAMGKRHPFPRLSPGKTVAGCVGSLVAGTLAGAACQSLGLLGDPRLGLASGLIAGGLWNLAAQAGDLFESGVKRAAGVKDSGTTFGPSGGLLDLVDSLLFTVPVSLLTWPLLFT